MPSETAIRPRQVRFEWSSTPLHWIPDDPMTSHLVDVLHLLLPAGERWFVNVYRQVLPEIADERVRDEVRGFMGQEAVHSRAHGAVLDHLRENGLETRAYTRRVDWMFERLLGDRRVPAPLRRSWLRHRLAIIAAIEHFTCVLGDWVICCSGAYEEIGADAVMLDLLRWHGAEEVEHRCVAFDTFQELGGRARYLLRVEGMLLAFPIWCSSGTAGSASWCAGTRPCRGGATGSATTPGRFGSGVRPDGSWSARCRAICAPRTTPSTRRPRNGRSPTSPPPPPLSRRGARRH